jgi:hypothetical protein
MPGVGSSFESCPVAEAPKAPIKATVAHDMTFLEICMFDFHFFRLASDWLGESLWGSGEL